MDTRTRIRTREWKRTRTRKRESERDAWEIYKYDCSHKKSESTCEIVMKESDQATSIKLR